MEVLIYTAIIGITTSAFTSIVLVVTRIHNQQNSAIEVNSQLNFVLSTVQRLVRESSYIDIATGTPVSALRLRARDSLRDPTLISISNGKISLQEGASSPVYLTSDAVVANNLSFLKISSYPGHDNVQIDIALSYNTQNLQQQFSKALTSVVARASAATFDSDIVPGSDNAYNVGLAGSRWQNLNLSGALTTGGEAKIGGIQNDGTGKVVCVKSDQTLGTCGNQPNASGVCTVCN